MKVRPMRRQDGDAILSIYGEGIDDCLATFETQCPSWKEWDRTHLRECRLVAESEGTIIGWAALSAVSSRECYRGVAEISVYVARAARGRGVGSVLLWALVDQSEKAGFWTLQGTTLEENAASVRMQERCGFRVVGTRERIGKLDDQWKTTVLTERRSAVVGVERREAEPEPRAPGESGQPGD